MMYCPRSHSSAGNTSSDTCPHVFAVRACISRYFSLTCSYSGSKSYFFMRSCGHTMYVLTDNIVIASTSLCVVRNPPDFMVHVSVQCWTVRGGSMHIGVDHPCAGLGPAWRGAGECYSSAGKYAELYHLCSVIGEHALSLL